MNFWEELDACKYNENEYLVEHLVEVIKDEGINNLEELNAYENKYFTESNMSKEEWVGWYQKSLEVIPEIEELQNDSTADKIKELRNQIFSTSDINLKIKNIIIVCALLEREFCFLVEAYNLVMNGEVSSEIYGSLEKIDNSASLNRKNIVLCGSMKVKDEILKVAEQLRTYGFNVLLPEECMRGEAKVIASRAHFGRIVNPNNFNILIVNATKNGIVNYIGPNSFAEIAFGFYHNKKVFLLNGMYEAYLDELIGWNVTCLNGDLASINDLI